MRWAMCMVFAMLLAGQAAADSPKDEHCADPAGAFAKVVRPSPALRERDVAYVDKPVQVSCGYAGSFDSDDDDDGDGRPDFLRVPHWIGYVLDRSPPLAGSNPRPRAWMTDDGLHADGLAPSDDSYRMLRDERRATADPYERGHLMPKYHAERLGEAYGWNTHNLLNAVPQRGSFNRGSWLDLECLTGAWANRFGEVWVAVGPVFLLRRPATTVGNAAKGELAVGVPEALFKIVVRGLETDGPVEAMAFVIPQDHPANAKGPWRHENWLVPLARIEELTGLRFFEGDPRFTAELKSRPAAGLWPAAAEDFDPACKPKGAAR